MHLLGAGVFAVLSVSLLRRGRGNAGPVFLLGVFAFACVFLLSMSGVYHLLSPSGAGREVMRRLDHAAIFALIAATFTPIHGILFQGWRRWLPPVFMWAVAATGISLKIIFFNSVPYWLGLATYLLLGWFGLISAVLLWRRFGASYITLPLLGGLAYTVGAITEFLRWPVLILGVFGPHEAFHIAVLAGIGFFWSFVHAIAAGDMSYSDSTS
ncbi:MAG: hemolysin III family protein [Planctomycetes bacterium]|nr:hemolysin III family protein [Planctomycetota bacterium]